MARTFLFVALLSIAKFGSAQNKGNFFIFVGERISIHELKPPEDTLFIDATKGDTMRTIYMDVGYKAKYRVIYNVLNKLDKETVEFETYDHYGKPRFRKYQYVLLCLFNKGGTFYHQQYWYYGVYPTADGRWAVACNPGNTMALPDFERIRARALPIKFGKSVSFKLRKRLPKYVIRQYCEPYFKVEGNKAFPLMGVYVEDLVKYELEPSK